MNRRRLLVLMTPVFVAMLLMACGGETLPKPKAMLRLSYPTATYDTLQTACAYAFEKNTLARLSTAKYNKKCWYNLDYPSLKATIYVSYHPVRNNLDSLLRDAQNLTQEHVVKADEIIQEPYVNLQDKVYGRLYKVAGNAASQAQFYITDSLRHFVSGSAYFKVRPNYDSILPAANYLYNDIRHIVETIQWQ